MLIIILFILAVVPLAEIALFIQAGRWIGLWPTLAMVIATAVIGASLLRRQGLAVLRSAEASIAAGQPPVDEVFDGVCLLVGGALLLTPGFLTDAVGFALLVPTLRARLRVVMTRRWVVLHRTPSGFAPPPPGRSGSGGASAPGPVIDGDYETIDEPSPPSRR